MNLGEMPYDRGVQDEVAPAAQRVAGDIRGLSGEVQQGLTQFSQALIESQTHDAHIEAVQKRNQLVNDLHSRDAIPASEVQQRLGDRYQELDPAVRAYADKPTPVFDQQGRQMGVNGAPLLNDNGTPNVAAGEPAMKEGEIPTFMVADHLYQASAKQILDEASRHIGIPGWQSQFQRAAAIDMVQAHAHLDELMREKAHQYQIDSVSRQALQYAWAGNFGLANLRVQSAAGVLGVDGQLKLRQQVGALQQAKPVLDALREFHVDPHSPTAAENLQKAATALADPSQTSLIPPEHLSAMATQVYRAQRQVENLDKGKALKERGRQELGRIMQEAGGDAGKALAAARALPETDVADEVERRIKQQVAADKEIRSAEDAPRVARLESGIDQGTSLDRTSDDYRLMSDEGRARVEAKLKASIRSQRSEGSEERRQQAETDRTREAEFDALPLTGVAGKDQTSADVKAMFPDVSPLGQARILAKQKRAGLELQKDQGVSRQGFLDQVTDAARQLGYGEKGHHGQPGDLPSFKSYMLERLGEWQDANPTRKTVPSADVKKMLVDAVTVRDNGDWFNSKQEVWRLRRAGVESSKPVPAEKQPDNVRAYLGGLGGKGAAAPAAAVAPTEEKWIGPDGKGGERTYAIPKDRVKDLDLKKWRKAP